MNGHARRLTLIGLHARVLLLNIQVVCSLANPLKKISLRQTRGDSMGYLYKSSEYGFNDVKNYRNIDELDPKYAESFQQTVCDVDGRFKFESLPAGGYYVVSTVFCGDPIQGGAHLMKRVAIINDEAKEITISK